MVTLTSPFTGLTLLAIANVLWNNMLTNSTEKVSGSPAAVVQVIVAEPPEVRPLGVFTVRAHAKGTATARTAQSFENMVN